MEKWRVGDRQTDRRNVEQLENKLNREPNIFSSQWVFEFKSRVEGERQMGIYQKNPAPPLIPLCIHGWLRRNTKAHFSHPVAPSNIHVVHIFAVKVGLLIIILIIISFYITFIVIASLCIYIGEFWALIWSPTLFKAFRKAHLHKHDFAFLELLVIDTLEAPASGKQSTLSARAMLGHWGTKTSAKRWNVYFSTERKIQSETPAIQWLSIQTIILRFITLEGSQQINFTNYCIIRRVTTFKIAQSLFSWTVPEMCSLSANEQQHVIIIYVV